MKAKVASDKAVWVLDQIIMIFLQIFKKNLVFSLAYGLHDEVTWSNLCTIVGEVKERPAFARRAEFCQRSNISSQQASDQSFWANRSEVVFWSDAVHFSNAIEDIWSIVEESAHREVLELGSCQSGLHSRDVKRRNCFVV